MKLMHEVKEGAVCCPTRREWVDVEQCYACNARVRIAQSRSGDLTVICRTEPEPPIGGRVFAERWAAWH